MDSLNCSSLPLQKVDMKKLQPEYASNMVNSGWRKRMIRMSMEKRTKMFEGGIEGRTHIEVDYQFIQS